MVLVVAADPRQGMGHGESCRLQDFGVADPRQLEKVRGLDCPCSAFFRKVFDEVAEQYPDVERDYAYADAMTVYLLERPEHYDVIVAENMFGDIISDLAAATVGGMGMSPSAELGDANGFFQAAHGSAPTIAGQNVANPYGTILSAASMLQWLGERHGDWRLLSAATQVEKSVEAAIAAPGGLTRDLGGPASTSAVTQLIIDALSRGALNAAE